MSENKQRSPLFKFFRAILKIIMLPVAGVMYVLKHPLWVAVVLFVIALCVAYYPMSKGVKFSEIGSWYMEKSKKVSADVLSAVADSESIVPEKLKEKAKKVQKELEDEKRESSSVKGENYNKKVVRDEKIEAVVSGAKNKKGFKKKQSAEDVNEGSVKVFDGDMKKAGGLGNLIKKDDKSGIADVKVIEQPQKDVEIEIKEETAKEVEEDTEDGVLQMMDDEYIAKYESKRKAEKEKKEAEDGGFFDLF